MVKVTHVKVATSTLKTVTSSSETSLISTISTPTDTQKMRIVRIENFKADL
jgi:hypothetical protein